MALPHENIVAAFGALVPCSMTMTFVGAAPEDEPLPEPLPDPLPEPLPDEPLPEEPVPDEPLPEEPVPDEPLPEEPVPDEPLPTVELLLDDTEAPVDEAEVAPLPQADNARTTAATAIVRNCQTWFVSMTLLPMPMTS